jgi:hypothetical protein
MARKLDYQWHLRQVMASRGIGRWSCIAAIVSPAWEGPG